MLARVQLNPSDSPNPFTVNKSLPLVELRPDIYFTVERNHRSIIDSRQLPNRLPVLVNFDGRGEGTPANPIALNPLLVVDGGVAVLG